MAFDAGVLRAVVWELNLILSEGKVEKITQPEGDEVDILMRSRGGNHRLVIRAGANLPRISLSSQGKESPATPPMFCMLLRKHLGGAKLLRVTQEDMSVWRASPSQVTMRWGIPKRSIWL